MRIQGLDYIVVPKGGARKQFGRVHINDQRIVIYDAPPDRQMETLLHEILHVVDSLTAPTTDDELDEATIERLGRALHQVLRDHPLDWSTGYSGEEPLVTNASTEQE